MAYEVLAVDEFRDWYLALTAEEQRSVDRVVELLEQLGTALSHPYSSSIRGSKVSRLRELRIQHQGRPFRVLYAFDTERNAALLVGGDKTGHYRWYETAIPQAERLYEEHLQRLGGW